MNSILDALICYFSIKHRVQNLPAKINMTTRDTSFMFSLLNQPIQASRS